MKIDCTHPRANHQHGTYLAWHRDGCRCEPCVMAGRRHSKISAYRTATGTHTYVDATPAREHVGTLLETLTIGQLEARSGVSRTGIRVLIGDFPGRPMSKRITRKTEAALLAVTPERVGGERYGLVDGTGTIRRIQALMALGWCRRWIEERAELSTRTGWILTCTPGPHLVLVATRDRIRALYDEIAITPPPATRYAARTRNLAASRGWHPPLAWDDETIDDPAATPVGADGEPIIDEVAVWRVVNGEGVARLHGAEIDAAIELAKSPEFDLPWHEIARRLGMKRDAVERRWNRTLAARRAAA